MSSAVTALSNSGPAIHFEDVRIGFDEGDILRGVSFRVEPRETKILLGETGTGKTLTLKLAAGLLTPSAGSVHLVGKGIFGMGGKGGLGLWRAGGVLFLGWGVFASVDVGAKLGVQSAWHGA